MATRHRVYDHIVKSFPANLPAKMAPLLAALNSSVRLIDNIESQKAEMLKAGKLTPAGIKEALANHAKEPIAGLYQASRAARSVKKEQAARRSRIKPEEPKDAIAADDMREARRIVREAGDNQAAILQTNDPGIMQAVLTKPPVWSGVSPALHAKLLENFASIHAGADVAEIIETENAADAVLAALAEMRGELREVVGLDAPQFDQLAAPIEAKATGPWLRRRPGSNEIRVVDLERGIERLPTPEELASGIEAATLDEFNARKAA